MKAKSLRSLLLLVVLCSVGIAGTAQSPAMPLGDVVRQPKPAKKAARVITNDDIPPRPPAPPEAPGDKDQAASTASPAKIPGTTGQAEGAKPPGSKLTSNPVTAKRLADLEEAMKAESQLSDRLTEALKRSGMSEAQRQALADSLKQSTAALSSYQEQQKAMAEIIGNPGNSAAGTAPSSQDKDRLGLSSSSTTALKPE